MSPVPTRAGLVQRRALNPQLVYPVVAEVLYRRPALYLTNLLGVRLVEAAQENA
jgi:hypothetical protein